MQFETLTIHREGAVLFAKIAAPPMNLLGPELVRDLVSLIKQTEADDGIRVVVFKSADPDYFISHVDVTRITEYREEAAKLTGEASIGADVSPSERKPPCHHRADRRPRTRRRQRVRARVRHALCRARVGDFQSVGARIRLIPGAGGAQHLARLMGRARALEVMLSAEDYDADLAERYGWINRALPADALDDFVRTLAHRIARFPAAGHSAVKDRVNAIALAPVEDFRRDSDMFGEGVRNPEAQSQIQAAMNRGFQTRDAEMDLARLLGDLTDH